MGYHSHPVNELPRNLLDHLRAQQDAMKSLLRDLALLESPSLDAASQEPVFARLAAELEASGLRARRLPGRRSGGQLWAVRKGRRRGAPAQLLIGHCDTVWPVGTVERMPVEVRDGRLSGPGVYDMKAGLVQGIFALRALRDLGLEPEVEPAFFINSDEEIGSAESLPRIQRLARRVRRVFVLEPSLGPEGKLKTRRKGSLRFSIRIHGRAAHSGLDPEKGASAILELSRVIQTLYGLADPERGITVNVGVVSGGLRANVVAPEARGFVLGGALAARAGAGFIPARKPGKLPHEVSSVEYALEYGVDALEMHKDALAGGSRVLVHDDLIATGGTAAAVCRLVEAAGAEVVGCAFLVELSFLDGRSRLGDRPVHSLVSFDSEGG